MDTTKYPDCYLHIEEYRSGESFIVPIPATAHLDLERLVKKWVAKQYGGELKVDGKFTPRLQGDYYAKIITDGRSPDCGIVWTSGGFYLTNH
jgi:hypothetical protein